MIKPQGGAWGNDGIDREDVAEESYTQSWEQDRHSPLTYSSSATPTAAPAADRLSYVLGSPLFLVSPRIS